jgi:uncharacterized SAM-binding protein YcdF (DUF218 family)
MKKNNLNKSWIGKISRRTRVFFIIYIILIITFIVLKGTLYAATSDPLAAVNNLSTFIFGLIRAIGLILLGFGVVQIGLSLKSHDPSQRANGFLTFAGGIVITFTREILALITG